MVVARRFNGGKAEENDKVPARGRLEQRGISIPWRTIRRDSVTLQHLLQLLHKIHLCVVPLLVVNVANRVFELRYTDAECRITVLPVKWSTLKMIVNPFWRAALNQLHGLATDIVVGNDKSAWQWSGIPPTASALNLFCRAIPAIYGQSLAFRSAGMLTRRSFVENTQCARML
jgi:hypothetical protein